MSNRSFKTVLGTLGIIAFLAACNNANETKDTQQNADNKLTNISKAEFKAGAVYDTVACLKDSRQQYALYIPENQPAKGWPLIILLDPHAKGNTILNKYKNLAKQFGFVLAASNSSKNGLPFSEVLQVGNNLINDVLQRVNIDTAQVYTAGFSGGAKVAIAIAKQNKIVKGAIYSGSAVGLQDSDNSFSLLGFAGTGDMNYSQLLSFDNGMSETMSHNLVEWGGTHEWPDSAAFRKAFYWLQFDAIRRKAATVNSETIKKYEEEYPVSKDKNLEALEEVKQHIAFLKGVKDVFTYESMRNELLKDAAIKKQMAEKGKLIEKEQFMKDEYYKSLYMKDMPWWQTEIKRLNAEKGKEATLDQRLLGFISLACYSICGKLVYQNDDITIEKVLAIYKLADPKNADQRYLTAAYLARKGKNKEAIQQLKEATLLGFGERDKALKEKAFSSLLDNKEFQQIVSKL